MIINESSCCNFKLFVAVIQAASNTADHCQWHLLEDLAIQRSRHKRCFKVCLTQYGCVNQLLFERGFQFICMLVTLEIVLLQVLMPSTTSVGETQTSVGVGVTDASAGLIYSSGYCFLHS